MRTESEMTLDSPRERKALVDKICEVAAKHGFGVKVDKVSKSSSSRYVKLLSPQTKSQITVRVSNHRPSPFVPCDISFHPGSPATMRTLAELLKGG